MKFCSLYSGSSGNSQFISTENIKILIDAGLSGKKIEQSLDSIGENPAEIGAIFVTHEHIDHIKGVGVLSRRYNIPIYANQDTWEAMHPKIGKIKEENIKFLNEEIILEDLSVKPFEISHDAAKPVGFNIISGDTKISLLTDTGCVNDSIKKSIKNAKLILLETNHDVELLKVGSYPYPLKKRILGDYGHLSNETAALLLTDILTKNNQIVLLGHLSRENNFPELAYKTVSNILTDKGFDTTNDLILDMTYRDKASKVYYL